MISARPQAQVGSRRRAWVEAGLLVLLGAAVYSPVLSYSFFWEDPFDIGQVEPYSYPQLLAVSNSNSYYRPLSLVSLKALKLGYAAYPAWAYHLFGVMGHLLAAALLYGFTLYLFRRHSLALAAGLIFLVYPAPFESTARASAFHSWLEAVTIGSLWLYAAWRTRGGRATLMAAIGLSALSLGLHENAIMLPSLALVLELWLVWQRRVKRFHPAVLVFYIAAAVFVLIWFSIPKTGEAPQVGVHPREALYLSQGLSFAIAGPLAWTGGLGLTPVGQAGVALLASAGLLLAVHWRANLPRLELALAWWAVAVSLAWLARPIEYLQVSPRVLYFPSFAAAIAWAGAADLSLGWLRGPAVRRALATTALACIVLPSAWALERSIVLYRNGSRLMDQITKAGAQAGRGARVLFVNVPDRFAYRRPSYPLGYWGMLLAPVSQDLGSFVWLTHDVKLETQSLSDFPLLAEQIATSPYQVNTRGVEAHASELLYDALVWADETYLVDYSPDGGMALRFVGDIRPAAAAGQTIGRLGDIVQLGEADAAWDGHNLSLTLRWLPIRPARPTDTVFVHVVDAEGILVAQADGDSLGGLTPPSAWRPGHLIVDRRQVNPNRAWTTGAYTVRVGMYDRATGERYPAFTPAGQSVPDGAVEVYQWIIR